MEEQETEIDSDREGDMTLTLCGDTEALEEENSKEMWPCFSVYMQKILSK